MNSVPEFTFTFDIETDSLMQKGGPKIVHALVLEDYHTGAIHSFADQDGYHPIAMGVEFLERADMLIGHNVLGFDVPKLVKLRGAKIDKAIVQDTLIRGRVLLPDIASKLDDSKLGSLANKHSLEAWGMRLQFQKDTGFSKTTDWSRWSPAMQAYCIQDVKLNRLVYDFLIEYEVSVRTTL